MKTQTNFCSNCKTDIIEKNICADYSTTVAESKSAPRRRLLAALMATLTLVLLAVVLPSCSSLGTGDDLDARIMSVFRVDGDRVSLTDADGAGTQARDGMRLHAGNGVSTGFDSFCYISLDADSIVKMDVSTDISIGQLTDRLLRIYIESGQVKVNVQNQQPEHELAAVVGNVTIAVRGTLFLAGVWDGGEAVVTVLSGSVDVNGVRLDAGYAMRVYDGIEMLYEVAPIDPGELDTFQLSAFLDTQGGIATADGDGNGGEENNEPYTDVQAGGNLTGAPPLSFQEIADAGFFQGVTVQDLMDAGVHGIDEHHIESLRRSMDSDPDRTHGFWLNYGWPLSHNIWVNREMLVYAVDSQNPSNTEEQLLRFPRGMSFRDAINAIAVGNPDILSFAENPTYENFAELRNEQGLLLDGPIIADDGTSQQIFININPDFDWISVSISLFNAGRSLPVSLWFQEGALTGVWIQLD